VEANDRDVVLFPQPRSFDERTSVAQSCALRLDLSIPTLIDDMENSTDQKYLRAARPPLSRRAQRPDRLSRRDRWTVGSSWRPSSE
jgi:hypothetical protein